MASNTEQFENKCQDASLYEWKNICYEDYEDIFYESSIFYEYGGVSFECGDASANEYEDTSSQEHEVSSCEECKDVSSDESKGACSDESKNNSCDNSSKYSFN